MRKLLRGALIAGLTCFVGIRAAEFVEPYSIEVPSTHVVEVASIDGLTVAPNDSPARRFTPTGRGCGNGYAQAYVTSTGEHVGEGVTSFKSPREARKAFNEWKGEGFNILEFTTKYAIQRARSASG